jgi:plasmid stabilization system protein ParE
MTTHRLLQRASARRDILAIIDRISDDNPRAAAAVYEAYEHSLTLLQRTPDMGRCRRRRESRPMERRHGGAAGGVKSGHW